MATYTGIGSESVEGAEFSPTIQVTGLANIFSSWTSWNLSFAEFHWGLGPLVLVSFLFRGHIDMAAFFYLFDSPAAVALAYLNLETDKATTLQRLSVCCTLLWPMDLLYYVM